MRRRGTHRAPTRELYAYRAVCVQCTCTYIPYCVGRVHTILSESILCKRDNQMLFREHSVFGSILWLYTVVCYASCRFD